MAIANSNDLTHIVRTSDQWKNTYDKYELIPTGVLCVELVSSDVTKIKIGDGHNIFSKLPYIGDLDLSKYYTKLETDTRIKEILTQEKVVRIKGIIGSKSDLPAEARCGDIYFVRQLSSSDNKYIEYIYSPDNTWEPLGGIPVDIDLSEYAKTAYVDDKIEQVNERIDDIEQHGTHTHPNKEILDQITEPYTTADKETLASLHNYDDTEIREMISQSSHTHDNKDILDATSAAFTKEDKSKLDQLNPYDDSTIKERITELERVAHEHSNKRILDQTTASFTKEYERKMRWIRMYTGCTGMEEGIAGLVPAAQAGEEDYVLSGSGEWVPQTGGGGTYELPIASGSTLGGIKVGDGLSINANGILSVVDSGSSITEGGGITITTDSDTGVKTIAVNAGTGLEIDQQTGELNVTVIGIDSLAEGNGINIVTDAQTNVKTIYVDVSDGLSINDSDAIELNKATTNDIGGVIIGDNINVSNGTISVLKATNNSLGVIKQSDGLSIDNDGALSVNVGNGLSIDNSTKKVNVNVGRALRINQNNDIDVNIATDNDLGIVKPGTGLTVDINGTLNATPYQLPVANNTTLGGIKIGDGIFINEDNIVSSSIYEAGPGIEFEASVATYTSVTDVWDSGAGWVNGSYDGTTSDSFVSNSKEFHSKSNEYFQLPNGATQIKLIGISINDTAFGGNHIDLFDISKHHIGTLTGQSDWKSLISGTVYLQFGIKWDEQDTQDISGSSIKSVTLQIKVPKNNVIKTKLGDGLTFDNNNAITLDESIELIFHCVGTPLT